MLELGDNVYQGGGEYFYRLRIGDFFPRPPSPTCWLRPEAGSLPANSLTSAKGLIEAFRAKVPSRSISLKRLGLFVPRQSNGNSTELLS